MRQHDERIRQLDLRIVVVTFELDIVARNYVTATGLDWPLLVDRSRVLYQAYGMHRGGWGRVLGPVAWGAYIKLLLRGRKLQRATDDVRQLGGDVLIDPAQIVRLHHVSRNPADRPAVESLWEVVEKCEGSAGT